METIRVKIKKNGQAEIKVEGHAGTGCTNLTKALQDALGSTTKSEPTSEYYQQEQQQQITENQNQG
jgi:uridine kinase